MAVAVDVEDMVVVCFLSFSTFLSSNIFTGGGYGDRQQGGYGILASTNPKEVP
jgi:hypothetical protein